MAKPKKTFKDLLASYKTYDPDKEGFGSPEEWNEAFRTRMGLEEARQVLGSKSPRALLGVALSATWTEIVKAFRSLVLRTHPDRIKISGLGLEEATKRTQEANAAYAILAAEFGKA